MNAATLGGRVKWERNRRGWRQADLAAMTGLTAATIVNVEHDRYPAVRETTLRALASALNVPVEYLRG